MPAATSAAPRAMAPRCWPVTVTMPRGSISPDAPSTLTSAPIDRSRVRNAVRVGLSPTSPTITDQPGRSAAAAIQKAADEKSPGIASSTGRSGWCDGRITTPSAVASTSVPIARKSRSVWSRVGVRSTTVVGPLADSPASRSALFTWALTIGSA